MNSKQIQLYITNEHECSYLPDRMTRNLVPDPDLTMDMSFYSQLLTLGYRRSGDHVYKPHSQDCQECAPCRIPVNAFIANKNQRRCLKRNQDLSVSVVEAHFTDEYFSLYSDYLNQRHADGGMANPLPDDFKNFLYSEWSSSYFLEVRKDERLLAVAVTDITLVGLSAVYTFFDPEESSRSLGKFCILKQIEQTRKMAQHHLYMGYWIKDCQKMRYKTEYRPIEILIGNDWLTQPD